MRLGGVIGGETYGYPTRDWDAAKEEARARLVEVAGSAKGTIAYSELAAGIRSIRFQAQDHPFHALLGQISVEEDGLGRGMLSVVVVHKGGDGTPGQGFFELATELGRNLEDATAFWSAEFDFVTKLHRRERRSAPR
jgi:hypothetical protein